MTGALYAQGASSAVYGEDEDLLNLINRAGACWVDIAVMLFEQIPEVRALLEMPKGVYSELCAAGVPAVQNKRTVQKGPADVTII